MISGVSTKRHFYLLFFCTAVIVCLYQSTTAQSGRRNKKEVSAPEPAVKVETKKETPTEEPSVRITSLKVVGEVQHDNTYYSSNELGSALKEFERWVKISKPSFEISRSGKMEFNEAKEQAEKETEIFVLWIGFVTKNDNYGSMYLEFVEYAVLTPKTGKRLTSGRIEPGQNTLGNPGGVLRSPGQRKKTFVHIQMREGVRELAAILVRGGWLD